MKDLEIFLKKIKNKTLLVVFPHPDDESFMAGGLLQRAMELGFAVTVLTITEGGRGKIHINGRGRSVSEIRREEMAEAMSRLGVADWIMWKFDDGKLRKTNLWRNRLRSFLVSTNPGVVVSYDLSGVSGHPDHISLGLEVLRYARENKAELLWPSFLGWMRNTVLNKSVERYLTNPEFKLELGLKEALKKWSAAFSHKSQRLEGFVGRRWWQLVFWSRTEWFARFNPKSKYKYRHIRFKI